MKLILLFAVVGLFVGCESNPKKDAGAAAPAAAPAKGGKSAPAKKGFEDEDISKSKPGAKMEGAAAEKITCTSGGDVRTLEMSSGEGKVCRLNYTKSGEMKEVASGVSDTSKCNEIRDRIKGNLEGAGFKCE